MEKYIKLLNDSQYCMTFYLWTNSSICPIFLHGVVHKRNSSRKQTGCRLYADKKHLGTRCQIFAKNGLLKILGHNAGFVPKCNIAHGVEEKCNASRPLPNEIDRFFYYNIFQI